MVTDDEKRELIAEAERLVRQSAAGGNPVSEFGVTKEIAFVRGVRFAAEALKGAITEPGRQYRAVRRSDGAIAGPWILGERAEITDRQLWREECRTYQAPGPWEVVPDV